MPHSPMSDGTSGRSCAATAALGMLMAGAAIAAQQAPPRFVDRVDVARTVVDARVLDDRGNPILGLTPDDFKVSIDGAIARVETATWVGGSDGVVTAGANAGASAGANAGANTARLTSTPSTEAGSPAAPGRLIVFLFQKDLEVSRLRGLMKMLLKSRSVLDTVTPDDRVAILSFDTHLKIWTDFTDDRTRLDRILSHDLLLTSGPSALQASSTPSLIAHLDPDSARRTYGIEQALELIGDALEPLPGSKSLVLIGYGFGQLGFGGVEMENNYGIARQALVAARTSVFSLDVTDADYHSLEAGLQIVSGQTGGFYAKTNLFPEFAMRKLAGALAGYYVLIIETPASQRTTHEVKTELTRRKGQVFATPSFSELAH